jgi:hypothetical protein
MLSNKNRHDMDELPTSEDSTNSKVADSKTVFTVSPDRTINSFLSLPNSPNLLVLKLKDGIGVYDIQHQQWLHDVDPTAKWLSREEIRSKMHNVDDDKALGIDLARVNIIALPQNAILLWCADAPYIIKLKLDHFNLDQAELIPFAFGARINFHMLLNKYIFSTTVGYDEARNYKHRFKLYNLASDNYEMDKTFVGLRFNKVKNSDSLFVITRISPQSKRYISSLMQATEEKGTLLFESIAQSQESPNFFSGVCQLPDGQFACLVHDWRNHKSELFILDKDFKTLQRKITIDGLYERFPLDFLNGVFRQDTQLVLSADCETICLFLCDRLFCINVRTGVVDQEVASHDFSLLSTGEIMTRSSDGLSIQINTPGYLKRALEAREVIASAMDSLPLDVVDVTWSYCSGFFAPKNRNHLNNPNSSANEMDVYDNPNRLERK